MDRTDFGSTRLVEASQGDAGDERFAREEKGGENEGVGGQPKSSQPVLNNATSD